MASPRPDVPPAWAEYEAEDAARKAEIANARAGASPVRLVAVDVPFGAVLMIAVQIAIAQALIAVVVLGVLVVLGML